MKSNIEWKAWGRHDPLYGVAALLGRSRGGSAPWTDADFYQLGAADWDAFRSLWERYGLCRDNCLEIGCGAGRMTAQLAQYFRLVHAVDVSPDMVEYAREHMDPAAVRFHVTDGLHLPLDGESVGAVFSTHVFQHFDSRSDAAACFGEIFRVMTRNSTMMIHVPVIAWPWGPFLPFHKLIDGLETGATAVVIRWQRLAFHLGLRKEPPMRFIWFDVNWLYSVLVALGFCDIEIHIVFVPSLMARRHPFVLARKR